MIRKTFICALTLLSVINLKAQTDTTVTAEEKAPALAITGSVDGYYRYDFANTSSNAYTSFTPQHNAFSLGMASVKFEHKGEKVSAVADLGFGPRAKDFAYTDNGITAAVKQLYVSYAPADWIKFSLGTWATHVGYELVDPQLNRNYSMSYMFTNGPFTHTGLKAEITKGKHGFMLGVSNATDFRIPPAGFINKKFALAQYSFAPTDKIKLYLNYVGGKNPDTSETHQFDFVGTFKFSDKFNIGVNATTNNTQFWDGTKNLDGLAWGGAALYLNYDPKAWFGLTLRGEMFNDKNQLKPYASSSKGGNIFATTLSANFKKGGFTFIPEFRIDNASEQVLFTNKSGGFTKSASSFTMAAIYSF
jgi:hypothetical protein